MERLKGSHWRKLAILAPMAALFLLLQLYTHTMCVVYAVVGFPCPACGTTRAVLRLLLEGDLLASLRAHPLFLMLSILCILWLRIKWFATATPPWWNKLLLATLGLYLVVYVIRLILLFPHVEPMVWNADALLPRLYRLLQTFFAKN